MKLVLFDIDKTLIDYSPSHVQAFTHAFKEVFGVDTHIEIINYHGKTDPQIMCEVLLKEGFDKNVIIANKTNFLNSLSEYVIAHVKNDKIKVMDGCGELLKELEKQKVLLGLLTGNMESIAYAKLNHVGLGHYFSLGGFGSDHYHRPKLVPLALKRASQEFGFVKNGQNTFVVGDTPLDIIAGQEAGIKTIGVATGKYSIDDLKKTGANFVLKDFTNKEEMLMILRKY